MSWLSKIAIRARNQLYAWWKWGLSFRKKTWELVDYPVVYRNQEPDAEPGSPMYEQASVATIVNWPVMNGVGRTKDKAWSTLWDRFESEKHEEIRTGWRLPRPGAKVRIKIASQERASAHPELARDFMQRVLNQDWFLLTDKTDLWHFHFDGNNDYYNAKIEEIYGVDVSDIESGNIAEILVRIAAARATSVSDTDH